jgi:hypothetical protein
MTAASRMHSRQRATWKTLAVACAAILLTAFGQAQIPVIPPGAPWRFLDNGTDQGSKWQLLEFEEGDWSSGAGQFGYGEGDETTLINPGPNRDGFVTTYFRHVFPTPPLVPPGMILELRLMRDDAAVVYLNGTEVFRDNLPDKVAFDTRALEEASDDGQFHFSVKIDPSLLEPAINVLAIEIHQARSDSPPDMSFDAALMLVQGLPPIFEQEPQCLTAFLGTNVQFFAFAVGATHLQWLHNDAPLPGETNSLLTLTNLQRHHVGQYRLRASNLSGTVVSGAGELQLELDTDGLIRNELVARDWLSLSGLGPAALFAAAAVPGGCQPPIFGMSHGSSYSYSTFGATTAPGETNHCGITGGHSKWSIFFANQTEWIILRTEGSDFDTVLAVYTWDGNDTHPLVPVVCDDNSGPNGTSRVEFLAVAGTLYYIAVDGVNGATGNVRLQIGGLELGTPAIAANGSIQVLMQGRRSQDRIYTLQCATNPAAPATNWMTVFATNVARTVTSWSFNYSTNPPAGTPQLFFNGTERP